MLNRQALKDFGLEKLAVDFARPNDTLQHDYLMYYPKKDDLKLRDSSIEQSFQMNKDFDKTSPMETPGVIHMHIG